jgi:prophage tail gpP-like protein
MIQSIGGEAADTFAMPGFSAGVVSLQVNGMLYEGWHSVSVSRSIKEMSGQFELDVADLASSGLLRSWMASIREGDACKVLYSGIPVVTGHVDVCSPSFDASTHTVKVQGRSKTADIVDTSAEADIPNSEMRETSLDQLARKLAKPHSINVTVSAKINDRFDVLRVLAGETKHEMLERYARAGAVAITDDADGNLRLMHVTDGAVVASLTEGVNILSGGATHRADNRYSDYQVKGQNAGSDDRYGRPAAEVTAKAKDAAVKRYRPFTLLGDSKTTRSDAKRRSQWESATRAGESSRATVRVKGWCSAPGKLLMPGDLVFLASPMLRFNRTLAIESVNLTQSESGTIAELSLVPPEALNPSAGQKGQDGEAATKPEADPELEVPDGQP